MRCHMPVVPLNLAREWNLMGLCLFLRLFFTALLADILLFDAPLPPVPLVIIVVLRWLSVVVECGSLSWLPLPLEMASLQTAWGDTHLHY